MARVVVDANIIISAAFGGKPLEAAIRATGNEAYISGKIEQELTQVFLKLSKKLTKEQLSFVQGKINELIGAEVLVDVSSHVVLSRDAKDDHYLSLCKEIDAEFLITGDRDLLDISESVLAKEGIGGPAL